eukprot:3773196-Prorocentrum_lima.AAC.1
MTSSLVGSEMCIRDRWRRGTGIRGGRRRRRAPTTPAHGCRLRCGAHKRSCLLYTSDAADDM